MRRKINIDIDQLLEDYRLRKTNKEISEKYQLHRTTVQRILKKNKIDLRKTTETSKKYDINDLFFEKINDQDKAYIFGLIYADGNLFKNQIEISLVESDKNILEAIGKKIYIDIVPLKWRKGRTSGERINKPQWRLFIVNKKIANDLRGHGLVENKSLKIRLPELRNDLYRHFIRGYFDGDGCLHISKYKGNNRVMIVSNPMFTRDLKRKIELEINIHCSDKKKTETVNTLNIYGNNQVKKFLDWIYNDANLKLERKYMKYLNNYTLKMKSL